MDSHVRTTSNTLGWLGVSPERGRSVLVVALPYPDRPIHQRLKGRKVGKRTPVKDQRYWDAIKAIADKAPPLTPQQVIGLQRIFADPKGGSNG